MLPVAPPEGAPFATTAVSQTLGWVKLSRKVIALEPLACETMGIEALFPGTDIDQERLVQVVVLLLACWASMMPMGAVDCFELSASPPASPPPLFLLTLRRTVTPIESLALMKPSRSGEVEVLPEEGEEEDEVDGDISASAQTSDASPPSS